MLQLANQTSHVQLNGRRETIKGNKFKIKYQKVYKEMNFENKSERALPWYSVQFKIKSTSWLQLAIDDHREYREHL